MFRFFYLRDSQIKSYFDENDPNLNAAEQRGVGTVLTQESCFNDIVKGKFQSRQRH